MDEGELMAKAEAFVELANDWFFELDDDVKLDMYFKANPYCVKCGHHESTHVWTPKKKCYVNGLQPPCDCEGFLKDIREVNEVRT